MDVKTTGQKYEEEQGIYIVTQYLFTDYLITKKGEMVALW